MKSGLAWGSFLCIICLYMKLPGVPDGGYGHLGAGAGAGGHLGDGHSIWSSSGGPDEAIDTPTMTVGRQEGPNSVEFRVTLFHFYIDS